METFATRHERGEGVGPLWWTLETRGLLAIAFGIIAVAWPGITLMVLLTLFGIYALVDGIVAILAAFTSKPRWLYLLLGLAGIGAGIVTFAYPGKTLIVLLYIIAIWAITTGIIELAHAITGTNIVGNRWLWGLSGVLSVLFGILLIGSPIIGLFSVVWVIGFFALVFGFAQMLIGFELRGYGQSMRGAMQH